MMLSLQNSKVETHRVTKTVTKSFVQGILSDGIYSVTEDAKDSKK
jgi:hypothetical protein